MKRNAMYLTRNGDMKPAALCEYSLPWDPRMSYMENFFYRVPEHGSSWHNKSPFDEPFLDSCHARGNSKKTLCTKDLTCSLLQIIRSYDKKCRSTRMLNHKCRKWRRFGKISPLTSISSVFQPYFCQQPLFMCYIFCFAFSIFHFVVEKFDVPKKILTFGYKKEWFHWVFFVRVRRYVVHGLSFDTGNVRTRF